MFVSSLYVGSGQAIHSLSYSTLLLSQTQTPFTRAKFYLHFGVVVGLVAVGEGVDVVDVVVEVGVGVGSGITGIGIS